jgi:hypothetical protein
MLTSGLMLICSQKYEVKREKNNFARNRGNPKKNMLLNRIIAFSIKNKFLIGLLTAGLILWGGYNFVQLPIDAVPDITNNQVQVITISPSLAPKGFRTDQNC